MNENNWYENFKYLQRIYEIDNSGDLSPFPKTWSELSKWFNYIDTDIPTIELSVLINRIEDDDFVCKNNVKELLSKKKILSKVDFNKLWKKIKNPEIESEETDTLNIYHEIENELRNKFEIVSFKREILIKLGNAYTNNLSKLLEYLNFLAKKYKVGYRTIKSDIIESLKDSNIVDMNFFCYDSWLLNFQNGYYNFIKDEFVKTKDCTKEFIFAINQDFNYNDSDCIIFKNSLDDCLKGNKIINRNDIFEFMAYSLMFGNFLKAFFLNIGDTNTGKTQVMEILKSFVPANNRIQVSLQRLTSDQFGSMGLNNIILCYYDDLSDKLIYDVSMIKSITGGASEISIEEKHGEKKDTKNTAKIWQNGNYIPKIYNSKDSAYIDRVIIIEFNNVIDRYSKKHIEQFYLTITKNKTEMNGIINELIKAGQRLYKRGNFRKSIKDYSKEKYIYKSNEIYAFLHDFTKEDVNSYISFNIAKDLINRYRIERKKSILSSHAIRKEFIREGIFKSETTLNKDKIYVLNGLRWKSTTKVQNIIDDYN